jgi:hypothetical protein
LFADALPQGNDWWLSGDWGVDLVEPLCVNLQ